MSSQTESYFERALTLFNNGEFETALTELNQALEVTQKDVKYRILYARIYLEMHNTTGAIEELQAVLRQGDRLAEAHYQLGCVYDFMRSRNDAIFHFTQAIRHDPEMIIAYERRALDHYFLKQYEEAIQDYNVALKHQPHIGLSYINRGRAYYASGDHLTAISDFTQGLYYHPHMSALILWSLAHWRVISKLDAIIAEVPDNADAYFIRGHAYETHTKKQLLEAIRDYTHAIGLSSSRPVFYLFRGRTYLGQEDVNAAAKDINHVLGLDPTHIDALILRGKIHHRQGDKQQAIVDWQMALKQSPHHPEVEEIKKMMRDG